MKILLAEDDARLRKNIVYILRKEFHHVIEVDNGLDALDHTFSESFDLLILDWMMPQLSGIEVCKRLRDTGFSGGILMLTAKDDTSDIIQGLDSGADDYLVKPFKMEELLARIRAVLRRKEKVIEQVIQVENLQLNIDSRVFLRDNTEIELTKNEFALLEFLFINKGHVLTREQICIYIWGYDFDVSNNSLDALVKLVRKKVDNSHEKSLIQNVRGIGYKLRDYCV
ncbi:response regulator transcription factor [Lysinibacillus fusiformis]|uniref:response regulator transcription factor n=1 Tax=Lysinibacillus fusiformis TaxID=28031 RepID=UPI000D3439E5|nr:MULTISPECIES: response regulator transcription factor [Lysinibacillus]MED4669390.1 response regulator transcription factor [Lysinibacillus fusiformis]QAS57880.1 DNA-binding response regulator [Lysinibacillus sphaericus]RDV34216.1 DNA-binding response regulator [Lysinibacillus fusiformis]GED64369.1 DNA-binding response regulator [Lysinibacillus fusiformis]